VRLALDGAFEPETPTSAPATRAQSPGAWLAWTAFGLAAVTAAALAIPAWRHWHETPPAPLSGRFLIPLPPTADFALSPSGRLLVYTSMEQGNRRRLWIRPLDSLDARPITGTDEADMPFWAPDEQHLGFFAQGKLKKVAITGGPAETLGDAPTPRGGTWNRDGVILFAPSIFGPLYRVNENGGVPVQVTKVADERQSHRFPEFIAGGNQFLFLVEAPTREISGIHAASLDGTAPSRIVPDSSHAVYVPPRAGDRNGALLFWREMTVVAQPFDGRTLRTTGNAVPVAPDVHQGTFADFGAFSASNTGVLTYRTAATSVKQTLSWIDRTTGKPGATPIDAQSTEGVALSPDETHAAVSVKASQASWDLWLYDLQRGTPTRLTFGPGRRRWPVWSPDGRWIFYAIYSGVGFDDLLRKPAGGSGAEEPLVRGLFNVTPYDISPDGKMLLYSATGTTTKDDLWLLPLEGARTPVKYLDSPSEERQAQFSPDGRRIAYASDESGQFQVYVQTVPASGAKRQISTQGGTRPRWRKDGKELYYLSPEGKLMAVPIKLGPDSLEAGAPQRLFDLTLASANNREVPYIPWANGRKFLAAVAAEGAASPVTVWIDWVADIGK
jgi:Tol biopolymer transport system component